MQIDLTQIILAVITLIFGLLMRYVIPSAKKNLDKNQMETVKVSMAEFNESMENLSQQRGKRMGFWTANKIVDHHKKQMKQILSDKQYKKFEEIFDLTVRNTVKINLDRRMAS